MIRCLTADCRRFARYRGLCGSHYQLLVRQVWAKRTTWAKLEAAGKCLPRKKPKNWYFRGKKG